MSDSLALVRYTDADRWLTEALETDPRVMADLGGPWTPDAIDGIHQRRLTAVAGGGWWETIRPDPDGPPVGAIGIWSASWEEAPISEVGWMILPEHQGHGYATRALAILLDRVRADGRWGPVHAFPGVTNVPSNALCKRAGFRLLGPADVDYGDRVLHCNHWVLPG